METHTPHEHQAKEKSFWDEYTINICIAAILAIVVVVNLFLANSIKPAEKVAPVPPALPKLELTSITTDCKECQDIDAVAKELKTKYNITKETTLKADSKEAKELAEKYKIAKFPTIILTGELEKVTDAGFAKSEDAMVFGVKAPYVDPKTLEVMGKVDATYLMAGDCTICANITGLTDQLKQNGVVIGKTSTLDIASDEGKALAAKYNISKAPTVVFSPNAKDYDIITQAWPQVGSVEKDGSYVLRALSPPYFDVAKSKVRGAVSLTLVNDTDCKGCYDVTLHRNILGLNFGIKPEKETIVDAASSEGKKLVEKYKLAEVPTFLLSGDVEAYEQLVKVWPNVGTVEDGTYVFRELSVLKMPYLNLSTGKIEGQEANATQG